MPAGRPSKYKKKYCEELIKHMSLGFGFDSFAADVSVHKDTLYEWAKQHKEFSDAKKLGQAKCLKYWERIGILGASGKLKGFNPVAYIFNMKNRFGWSDKTDLKITGDLAENKNHELLKSVDRSELLKLVKKKAG